MSDCTSVVVLRHPDKATGGLEYLRHHVVDEAVLVRDACFLKLFLVFAYQSCES